MIAQWRSLFSIGMPQLRRCSRPLFDTTGREIIVETRENASNGVSKRSDATGAGKTPALEVGARRDIRSTGQPESVSSAQA